MSGSEASTPEQVLEMSDEDFLNMALPPAQEAAPAASEAAAEGGEPAAKTAEELEAERLAQENHDKGDPDPEPGDEGKADEPDAGADADAGKDDDKDAPLFDAAGKPIVKDEPKELSEAEKAAKAAAADPSLGSKEKVPGQAAPYVAPSNEEAQTFFKEIMTPFKANGKLITLKDPKEAVQLMQMGANYTRKMQDIQPHRKMLTMLQNNDLLDEGKLDYLIALDKRDPEAIKKLIKDAGIDPLDIDTSTESTFRTGNHQVSDNEVALNSVMEELSSTPDGQVTISTVNTTWDQASKEALWSNPEILTVIHSQRENGVYAAITEEMDRQKILGTLPATTPFLKAYEDIGKQLYSSGAADPSVSQPGTTTPTASVQAGQPEPKAAPEAVATRTAAPKPVLANGDKANAASISRTTPRKAKELVNPLAMSDEEFLKQFQNRL